MSAFSVSVIIPAYRAARTITRAVDSVLAQTAAAAEVVVVDDGSPDDLASALAPYGDRVRLLRKRNGGASSARNLGVECARGNLIAFLDADDYWEPTKLARQLEVLRRHPEVGLVAGRFFEELPGCPRGAPAAAADEIFDRVLSPSGERAFEVATRVWTGTVLVRREVLGAERFVSGLEPAEDRDLWARLVTVAPVWLLAEPLTTAVLVPGSLSRSNADVDNGNMLRVVHRHGDLLGRRGLRKWETRVYRQWAASHLGHGRPRAALAPAVRRLRRQPFSIEGWWVLLKSATLACVPAVAAKS